MITPELKQKLMTTKLCHYLSSEELEMISNYCQIISFSEGDLIIQQGKLANGIYVIIQGTALVTAKILGSGITHLSSLKEGSFVGEISLIKKIPAPTSVIASKGMITLFIPGAYFEMMSLFLSEIKYKIMHAIIDDVCERLISVRPKILNVMDKSGIHSLHFGNIIKKISKFNKINFEDLDFNIKEIKNDMVFKFFTEDEFNHLLNFVELVQAPKNCSLINEGESNKCFFFLLRGAVQSSIIQDNKLAKLSIISPLHFFCGISFVNCSVSSIANYSTRVRSELLIISEKNILTIQSNYISLWHKLFNLIAQSFIDLEYAANKLDVRLNSEFYNVQALR